jgi:carboxyl-terminal processing protease
MRANRLVAFIFLLLLGGVQETASAQQPGRLDSFQLARAHQMLRTVHDEIKKNYYDPKYHGINLDEMYAKADRALDESGSNTGAFLVIAEFVATLQDSHTFFVPPDRVSRMNRGFRMEAIGDSCFVTQIEPKTDAANKLHLGDRILTINGYTADRKSYETLQYLTQVLIPTPTLRMELEETQGSERTELVKATFSQGKKLLDVSGGEGSIDYHQLIIDGDNYEHRNRERLVESGDIAIWKMPSFETTPDVIDTTFDRVKKHGTLIIDLRGNPGGYIDILKQMLGHVLNHEVKLADRVSRKDTKPEMVKASKLGVYNGKIIVLIDSNSASAAELFARVIQLEHRGVVVGDQSAGAVMEARQYSESEGVDTMIFYALSVTSANLVMADGKSLEKTGVIPDVLLLPSANDLAAGLDPVLSKAVAMAGGTMDPATAGKLFPYEWPHL